MKIQKFTEKKGEIEKKNFEKNAIFSEKKFSDLLSISLKKYQNKSFKVSFYVLDKIGLPYVFKTKKN